VLFHHSHLLLPIPHHQSCLEEEQHLQAARLLLAPVAVPTRLCLQTPAWFARLPSRRGTPAPPRQQAAPVYCINNQSPLYIVKSFENFHTHPTHNKNEETASLHTLCLFCRVPRWRLPRPVCKAPNAGAAHSAKPLRLVYCALCHTKTTPTIACLHAGIKEMVLSSVCVWRLKAKKGACVFACGWLSQSTSPKFEVVGREDKSWPEEHSAALVRHGCCCVCDEILESGEHARLREEHSGNLLMRRRARPRLQDKGNGSWQE
jgi:hypothetical protein